jgi:peptidoglycan hydrolase CwlO-like protein
MDAPTKEVIIAAIGVAGGALLPAVKRWLSSSLLLGRDRISDARHDKDRLWEHVAGLEGKIGVLEGRIQALETQKETLIKENAAKDVMIAKIQADNAHLQEHIDTFEEENRGLESEVTRLRSEHRCTTCPERAKAASA